MAPAVLPDDLKALVTRVNEAFTQADRLHSRYRTRWERYFSLWSNYNDALRGSGVDRRDRDQVLNWAKREWGAELFIPLVFSTVETVVPRAISQLPRMLVSPRPYGSNLPVPMSRMADNAENHRLLLDAQQSRINYELILEDIARNGFMLGIGWQKTGWQSTKRSLPKLVPHIYTGDPCVEFREEAVEDPTAECLDPFDVFWDPYGHNVESCDYIIHRTWRNKAYVTRMIQSGRWPLMPDLTSEDIGRGSGTGKYDSVWQGRMRALGLSGAVRSGELHEVWEFHDGAEVITILDRQWPVQKGPNPTWHGELPFQCFRPTPIPSRMVGKGEIEPIEDLQAELNTLRSQRRDAATLALIPPFFYQEGLFDPDDARWAAGALIPTNGDPSQIIRQIQVGEPPSSSYREEDAIKVDADRTSGVSDAITGADPSGGLSSTATGAQLVNTNAGKRIEHKTRRLQVEIIASGARQWIAMNQMKVMSLPPIQKPKLPTPGEPDERYQWIKLGLLDLAGEFMVSPEGGSPAADNIPQKRADATQIRNSLIGDPMIDQRMIRLLELRKLDVPNPEAYIAPPPAPPPDQVPPATLDDLQKALVARGMPAQEAGALIAEAVRAARSQQQADQQQGQQPQQPQQQQLPPGPPVAA